VLLVTAAYVLVDRLRQEGVVGAIWPKLSKLGTGDRFDDLGAPCCTEKVLNARDETVF
jgi:hypothetical protein